MYLKDGFFLERLESKLFFHFRWLLSKGKTAKARKVIEQIARENKREVPKELYDEIDRVGALNKDKEENTEHIEKPKLKNLFRPKALMFR